MKANIIGNIYRVPKELLSDFHLFQEEFDEALELLRNEENGFFLLKQLTTYLDNNNLIHNHQYGFRKRHSTEYAALHIVDYLNSEMDLKGTLINLYLDLSKAFDSLSHKILISKLKHYSICD